MDTDQFWKLIETARKNAEESGRPFDEVLVDLLAARPKQEILAYDARFGALREAVYRWDLWAAAYLIGGGCSDDSFMDFRAGLIAQGRDWYERAAADPDRLADHPGLRQYAAEAGVLEEVLFYESVNYAASRAYERLTAEGEEDYYEASRRHRAALGGAETDPAADGAAASDAGADDGMGEEFDFDDDAEMHRRLPRLAALYLDGPTDG
jgi:hypothetical protein